MNSKIISVINQKGGCGKTTITMNLAGTVALRYKKRVLIVDGDTQASATKWAGCAAENNQFPCNVVSLAHAGNKAHRSIVGFINDYDLIMVDCPPNAEADFNASALLISTLALVPIKPSSTDLWAIDGIIKLINSAAITNENLKTLILPNMCEPNKKLSNSILSYFKNEDSINLSDNTINNRTVYGEVALSGETVYTANNSKAKNEIALLADEIINLLG